jgi:cellulose synthase/poly-beta-1,6-N-acetylglucosamine synthase-like glycosyltransferase
MSQLYTYLLEFLNVYEWFIAGYASFYIISYLVFAFLSYYAIRTYVLTRHYINEEVLIKSNEALGVSVIAPAFNEGATIVYNVKSLLSLSYPNFEVIIVNDGSSDDSLQKLIDEFELVIVPFFYQEHIPTAPVRGHYKSKNPIYSKLLVVDKENRKSKADASNAGINSSQYPLFLCTDVDCILKRNTLVKLVKPFIESKTRVIATGAAIRSSNSCEVNEGFLIKVHFPKKWYPMFQELEYVRAFLFGRMAWSQLNSLILVSGGLGMFDKEVVIEAGGYMHTSLGEDMELILRMRKVMYDKKKKFKIKYIPESLCWTEVPPDLKILMRQRIRWARGLIQTLVIHKDMFFKPKYGRTSFFSLPYFFFFEFLAPIIEVMGILLILTGLMFSIFFVGFINFSFLLWTMLFVYLFYINITIISILLDELLYKNYANIKEIMKLIGMAIIEPLVYHPVVVVAAMKGYWQFFTKKEAKWGVMVRKGFTENKKKTR